MSIFVCSVFITDCFIYTLRVVRFSNIPPFFIFVCFCVFKPLKTCIYFLKSDRKCNYGVVSTLTSAKRLLKCECLAPSFCHSMNYSTWLVGRSLVSVTVMRFLCHCILFLFTFSHHPNYFAAGVVYIHYLLKSFILKIQIFFYFRIRILY